MNPWSEAIARECHEGEELSFIYIYMGSVSSEQDEYQPRDDWLDYAKHKMFVVFSILAEPKFRQRMTSTTVSLVESRTTSTVSPREE